jgi:hypothetical protein
MTYAGSSIAAGRNDDRPTHTDARGLPTTVHAFLVRTTPKTTVGRQEADGDGQLTLSHR